MFDFLEGMWLKQYRNKTPKNHCVYEISYTHEISRDM